jgi:hypothetical protein
MDEDETKEIFDNIIMELNEYLNNLDEEDKTLRNKFAEKNGFIKENVESLMLIDDSLKQMKLNAFWENYNSFLKLEPKLEILYNYCTKFKPNIQREKNILDLIESYKNEPADHRLEPLRREIKNKKEQLEKAIVNIASKNNYFLETDIDFNVFELDYSVQEIISKYSQSNYKKLTEKIILCPFCASLFKSASNASYNLLEARRREYEDD